MAQLSGSTSNVATTIADINALHSTDWLKYSTGGIITKSGGGSTITASSGGFDLSSAPIGRTIGWTNGTPTASGSDDNARFDGSPDTFALPADTAVRTVVLYLGTSDFSAGVVQFTIGATLSDGSAAPYSFTTTGPNVPWNITLTYAAASAGQTLNITVTPTTSWAFFSAIGYSTAAASLGPSVDNGSPVVTQASRRNQAMRQFGGEPLRSPVIPLVKWAPDDHGPRQPPMARTKSTSGEPQRSPVVPQLTAWPVSPFASPPPMSRPKSAGGEPLARSQLAPWDSDMPSPLPRLPAVPRVFGGEPMPSPLAAVAMAPWGEASAARVVQRLRIDAGSAHALPRIGVWVHVNDLAIIRRATRLHDSTGVPVQLQPIAKWAPEDQQHRPKKCPAPYYELCAIIPNALAPIPKLRPPLFAFVDDVTLAISVNAVELVTTVDAFSTSSVANSVDLVSAVDPVVLQTLGDS